MARVYQPIDTVRASRDGHEYHEAWTARKAMQLLLSNDNLAGIAVEGLEPGDQARASSETVEVADLTLYYGENSTFKGAARVDVLQFKYSIGRENIPFRAADAKKTVEKFVASYDDYKKNYGALEVRKKLHFELITNRPIDAALQEVIEGIASGKTLSGDARKQAAQFKKATGLNGTPLEEFAARFRITGLTGNLADIKIGLSRMIVDWSATYDARARVGDMRQMVRDKAGHAGTNKNVIRVTDVIAALGISDESDLLPCPAVLVDVGEIVEREQLQDAISLVPRLSLPLLIHSAGGVGKTVFMQSLADSLRDDHEVVFFDCFGGGAYRLPEDARHLPNHGLVHIANSLACKGLCDPILPGADDVQTLLRTFRRRLIQCVSTLSRASRAKGLLLFIDAIDNAAEHARDSGDQPFPTLLVESLGFDPVPGVTLILSSRSHRIPIASSKYHNFKLEPFTLPETETYLRARLPDVKEVEIRVAHARSEGNGRILQYLLESDRGLLDPSEIDNRIELDDLIRGRIDKALKVATERGYKAEETDAFLAGLAVLPPPVPLDEYAEAHGMALSAIESFASDLWPLLERTKHGLMFRDEPTETLVRQQYASCETVLRRVAENLLARQDRSVYAARALPGLLQKIGDGAQLFDLAFDERFPVTSTLGQRNIRYARLKAAVRHAAGWQDHNRLVHLLVELSTIAAVDQRGADYIVKAPELVIAANDVDATRRLFETRTSWQGTRHARLAIATALSGDSDEALRHAVRMEEWLTHRQQRDREERLREPGPECLDIASIPFILCMQKRFEDAAEYVCGWSDWYAYEMEEHVLRLLHYAETGLSSLFIDAYLDCLPESVSGPAAALSSLEVDDKRARDLTRKLAKACKKAADVEFQRSFGTDRPGDLGDGMRKAAALALLLGSPADALTISRRAPHERPRAWSFSDHFSDRQVFPFLFHTALLAAIKGTEVREKDIIPSDLVGISKGMRNDLEGAAFRKNFKKRLEKHLHATKGKSDSKANALTHEQKSEAERFLSERLEPLLTLTRALTGLLSAPRGKADKPFTVLLDAWAKTGSQRERYGIREFSHFFQALGRHMAILGLSVRRDLKPASVKAFLRQLHKQEIIGPSSFIEVVSILAKRPPFEAVAGEQAMEVKAIIDRGDDVTYRAGLYADLARAILPASVADAAAYFRFGLDQMDAIGSGDHEFTNELLLFASSLKGEELEESGFHTLTNICELNLPEETEKFAWFAFGKALSRAAGCRGLAKLSRWDDRAKVPLEYSLLPYITALLEDGKIDPEDALALNRLADPAEFFACDTGTLATAIDSMHHANEKTLISELIAQFMENNHGLPLGSLTETLAAIAKRVIGPRSAPASYLSAAHSHFSGIRDERNENVNYRGKSDPLFSGRTATSKRQDQAKRRKIVNRTDPTDEASLAQAIDDFKQQIGRVYELRDGFFDSLRAKVSFGKRAEYIRMFSVLENENLYIKLNELRRCKEAWGASSAALQDAYKAAGEPLVRLHTDDLVSFGRLAGPRLKEISELSSLPASALALEVVKLFADPNTTTPASVWLGLACFACEQADEGEGQAALMRLLGSDAAKLSSGVPDGPWKKGLYPDNEPTAICAGLVWRMLGAPAAPDRWRAAHSVRCFARLERWGVFDALVAKLRQKDAHPFQAPELSFYIMHARLWLLIALARIALDDPKAIARYKDAMVAVVRDTKQPHVLMKHFAASAVLACADAGACKLPTATRTLLQNINQSPHAKLQQKLHRGDDFYSGRRSDAPKPKFAFHLDYDLHKYDVQGLSRVFGKPGWKVNDLISHVVRSIDPQTKSMYESGGRDLSTRQHLGGMTSRYHTYGQQLGWHAMFLAAGRLLHDHPVIDAERYYDTWDDWLGSYLLTRKDGLWLADGMDRAPPGAMGILLEKGPDSLVLTGDKAKILALAGLDGGVKKDLIVAGHWRSADHINVRISSAFVKTSAARKAAKNLIEAKPMLAWLPFYSEDSTGDDYLMNSKDDSIPWLVHPSPEGRLDDTDPIGSIEVVRRPRIARAFGDKLKLHADDPFGRVWKGRKRRTVACSAVWGGASDSSDDSSVRLSCSAALLKEILTSNNVELLLLIRLEKYDQGYRHESGKYTHTLAVIRLTRELAIEYYKGKINHLHKKQY